MIVGAAQWRILQGDKQGNLDRVEALIDRPVDLVVLPELFSTGYYFDSKEQALAAAEPVPGGYTVERLCGLAAIKRCHLAGAIVEWEKDKLFVTAVLIGPEGYIGKHRKRHLTDYEKRYYACGKASGTFDVQGCATGLLVCLEGWFPESARELMLLGAQVLCHTGLTCQQRTLDILRVRAIENKAFVVMANAVGAQLSAGIPVEFRGDSRVIDFEGNILANAGREEMLVTAHIDERLAAMKRTDDCEDLVSESLKHKDTLFGG